MKKILRGRHDRPVILNQSNRCRSADPPANPGTCQTPTPGTLSRWEPSGWGEDCPDLPDYLIRKRTADSHLRS